jgi:hypothetical protein
MTGRLDGFPADELRALIRDVLRDVLPATAPSAAATSAAPPSGLPAGQPPAVTAPAVTAPAVTAPATLPPATPPPAAARATSGPAGTTRQVRLETDADVRQFALDIVRLADNPARRLDLLAGRLTFTMARRAGDEQAPGGHRIETGAVTERAVQSAAKAGQRLVLGPRAVLTPLARDRALALGVPIERER